MRKLTALCLALLLAAALPFSARAEEWSGADFTLTAPAETAYILSPALAAEDPLWTLAGVSDPAALLEDYRDMGVVADFRTQDGASLKLMRKESASTARIFDLSLLDEEERASFLDGLIQAQNEEVRVEKSWEDINGQPFVRARIDTVSDEGEAHELLCGTIFNGHSLTFDVYGGVNPITEEEKALLAGAAQSLRVTQRLEKPETQPLGAKFWAGVVIVALLLLILLSPLVYLPLHNRAEKRKKEAAARRLSEYRREHRDSQPVGEPVYINETECTLEVIRAFSRYHAYRRNFVSLLIGCFVSVLALAAVFGFDLTWWLKIAAVAVALFYLYRAVSMPASVEKVQRRVFQRGVSNLAQYTFFEEGFRVTGIQSAALYPYFQITDVKKNGEYLYLYYSLDNAYILDRRCFTKGGAEEFLAFIESKTKE